MKKAFSARRVPRKVGQDDEPSSADSIPTEEVSESTLIRPSSKPRKASSLRKSFGPTAIEDEDNDEGSGAIVAPKRSNLSRVAIQRNASKRSSLLASSLPTRHADDDDDRPSYGAASLQELRDSTPNTPHDHTTDTSNSEVDDVSHGTSALDLSAKFDTTLARYQQASAIPSEAEIAEKKARRARLAQEQAAEEFISLDLSDPELDEDLDDNVMRDDSGRLVLKPKGHGKEAESRLVREDEDVMENFDEFTEADGKILLGRRAEAEAARKRRADMAAQIAEAEGASDWESDVSERERNEAFESAQTKHGTYASQRVEDSQEDLRPRTPPIISSLPTLDGVIERLRRQMADMQRSRMQRLQEMEALQREKIRLGEEEIRIQRALKETAEKFAQLRAEKGIRPASGREGTPALLEPRPSAEGLAAHLGLGGESGATTDVESAGGGHAGLGFGMAGRGLESLGASAIGSPAGLDTRSDEDTGADSDVMT